MSNHPWLVLSLKIMLYVVSAHKPLMVSHGFYRWWTVEKSYIIVVEDFYQWILFLVTIISLVRTVFIYIYTHIYFLTIPMPISYCLFGKGLHLEKKTWTFGLSARVQASCWMPIQAFRCVFRAIRQWSWHMARMMRWTYRRSFGLKSFCRFAGKEIHVLCELCYKTTCIFGNATWTRVILSLKKR